MATNYWTSRTPRLWSDASGWSLGHAPAATEDVIFDGASDATGVCSIAANSNKIGSLRISSGFPSLGIKCTVTVASIRVAPSAAQAANCISVYPGFVFDSDASKLGELDVWDDYCPNGTAITVDSTLESSILNGRAWQFSVRTNQAKTGVSLSLAKLVNFGITFPIDTTKSGSFLYRDTSAYLCPCFGASVSSFNANYTATFNCSDLVIRSSSVNPPLSLRNMRASFPNLQTLSVTTVTNLATALWSDVTCGRIDASFTYNPGATTPAVTTNRPLRHFTCRNDGTTSFRFASDMTLSGNFTLTGRQMNMGKYLVFDGTSQTVTLNSDYTGAVRIKTPGQTVRFTPTAARLVLPTYVAGDIGNGVTLGSTAAGSPWKLVVPNGVALTKVSLSDCQNDGTATMDLSDPSNVVGNNSGVSVPPAVSAFHRAPARTGSSVDSTASGTVAVAKMWYDSFFSGKKVVRVDVHYVSPSGRQRKVVTHLGNQLRGTVNWSQDAEAGTWQKTRIVVFDEDGARHALNRSDFGTGEDVTVS